MLAMPARRRKKKDKNNDALCTKLAVPEEPPNVFAGTDMEEERQLQMACALSKTTEEQVAWTPHADQLRDDMRLHGSRPHADASGEGRARTEPTQGNMRGRPASSGEASSKKEIEQYRKSALERLKKRGERGCYESPRGEKTVSFSLKEEHLANHLASESRHADQAAYDTKARRWRSLEQDANRIYEEVIAEEFPLLSLAPRLAANPAPTIPIQPHQSRYPIPILWFSPRQSLER